MRVAVRAILAALIVRCAAAATVPAGDEFSAPPFCPHSAEAGPSYEPSSVFFDDIPEFNSSELGARLRRQWDSACSNDCSFDKIFTHHREHYKTFDRVVVMDMSGLKPLNGLGNTLGYYIPFLRDGIHLGRAAFLRRNLPECAPRCSFDPAEFFGGRGGIDYRWSNATACAVARAMSLRGEKEHVFSLVFNESSELREAVGAVDETTGEYLQGYFDFYTLLSHPSVAPLPWVRFLLPPATRPGGPTQDGWSLESAMTSLGHSPPGDLRDTNPELYRAACLAGDPQRKLSAGPPTADVGRCGVHAFLHPAPRLQRLLAPLLPALDDTRKRCGAIVGVHLRSGYADMAAAVSYILLRTPPPPPPPLAGTKGAAPESAADAIRNAWAVLQNATRPCPQRCHIGKPPDKSKGYLDDADTPGCKPDGIDDAGDVCMDWPNNQLALWAAREAQANHDAHNATKGAGAAAGAVRSGGGNGTSGPQQSSPLRFDIGEEEIGREVGLAPAIFSFAAWKAQEVALKARAVRRAPHPPCALANHAAQPSPEPDAPAAAAWLVYVAGDLPLFVATAHASPSLRGHVIDAGRSGGKIGHVGRTNAGDDQSAQAVWSRSVLDLYVLSLCDYVVAAGSSTFTNAATLLQLPGFAWIDKGDFRFHFFLRTSGRSVKQREGEVGWGIPLYASMADAIERLEAAGVGGSGVV